MLPEPAASYLVNIVHDELVLEVPEALVGVCKKQLETAMIGAADTVLAPWGITATVHAIVADYWMDN